MKVWHAGLVFLPIIAFVAQPQSRLTWNILNNTREGIIADDYLKPYALTLLPSSYCMEILLYEL